MAKFIPPYYSDDETPKTEGRKAERAVLDALSNLDDKWTVFHSLEWRELDRHDGERIGEADVVLFHPDLGILCIEIKSGGVICENGQWFHESFMDGTRMPMRLSPFSQSRRNMIAVRDKLARTPLGREALRETALTYTVWFPDLTWTAPLPPDVPNGSFILDSRHARNTGQHLKSLMTQARPNAKSWSPQQAEILVRTLAPEVNLIVPLGVRIGELRDRFIKPVKEQISIINALRKQKRLLVEGCAGSGKTVLAVQLAREHALAGKKVLFTCFNKNLADHIAAEFSESLPVDVLNFHKLVETLCNKHGIAFEVPKERDAQVKFFDSVCPELLYQATQFIEDRYDTLIVDEAFDFKPDWWVALEALGRDDKSFYVFFDKNQCIFPGERPWSPPFEAEPVVLDVNVRNTRPIGDYALKLGNLSGTGTYAVEAGLAPVVKTYKDASEIAPLLRSMIQELIGKGKVAAESIVVLSPYKYSSDHLLIKDLVEKDGILTTATNDGTGKVRFGTIQAFKGLEADVVILCGIDGKLPACSPATLYVGATRARAMLQVIQKKQ